MSDVAMTAGDKQFMGVVLRARRAGVRMSLVEVARKCGVGFSHVAQIERGERRPSEEVARRLAAVLELKTNFVLAVTGHIALPDDGPSHEETMRRLDESLNESQRVKAEIEAILEREAGTAPAAKAPA